MTGQLPQRMSILATDLEENKDANYRGRYILSIWDDFYTNKFRP